MDDNDQRRMLGEFVRAHREHLKPEGQPGRRRTPGLRREELAVRAGISATWCTWIEQGRDVQPSPQTLARLAIALALTRAERAYLFVLAGRRDPAETSPPPAVAASFTISTTEQGSVSRGDWSMRMISAPAGRAVRSKADATRYSQPAS